MERPLSSHPLLAFLSTDFLVSLIDSSFQHYMKCQFKILEVNIWTLKEPEHQHWHFKLTWFRPLSLPFILFPVWLGWAWHHANRLSSSTQAVRHISSLVPTTAPTQSYGASLAGYQHDMLPLWHHKVHLAEAVFPLPARPNSIRAFLSLFCLLHTHPWCICLASCSFHDFSFPSSF